MDREQIAKDILKIIPYSYPSDMLRKSNAYKLADYIETELEKARKEAYSVGYQDGLKENNNVSSFSLGSFLKQSEV